MSADLLDDTTAQPTEPSSVTTTDTPDLSGFDSGALFGELKNRLPEEYRHENFMSHKGLDTVAKSYMEQNKMIGQKAPKAPASPQDYGMPEGFTLEGSGISQEELDAQREYYHSLNIPKEQGDALVAKWLETENSINAEINKQYSDKVANSQKYLQDTFGESLAETKQEVVNLMNNNLPADLVENLRKSGAYGNEYVIHALAEIAKHFRDDNGAIGNKPNSNAGESVVKEYEFVKNDLDFKKEMRSPDRVIRNAANKRFSDATLAFHQYQIKNGK